MSHGSGAVPSHLLWPLNRSTTLPCPRALPPSPPPLRLGDRYDEPHLEALLLTLGQHGQHYDSHMVARLSKTKFCEKLATPLPLLPPGSPTKHAASAAALSPAPSGCGDGKGAADRAPGADTDTAIGVIGIGIAGAFDPAAAAAAAAADADATSDSTATADSSEAAAVDAEAAAESVGAPGAAAAVELAPVAMEVDPGSDNEVQPGGAAAAAAAAAAVAVAAARLHNSMADEDDSMGEGEDEGEGKGEDGPGTRRHQRARATKDPENDGNEIDAGPAPPGHGDDRTAAAADAKPAEIDDGDHGFEADGGVEGVDDAGGRPTRARRGRGVGAEGGTDSDVGEPGQSVDGPETETETEAEAKGRGTKRGAPDDSSDGSLAADGGLAAASAVTFSIDSPDTSPEPEHSDSDGENPEETEETEETEESKKGSERAWRQSVMQLWNQIAENKNANLFRHPVNPKKVEGYDAVVYRPMDLATIKKSIETGVYTTIRDVEHDILLMFTNAIIFNQTGEFM